MPDSQDLVSSYFNVGTRQFLIFLVTQTQLQITRAMYRQLRVVTLGANEFKFWIGSYVSAEVPFTSDTILFGSGS